MYISGDRHRGAYFKRNKMDIITLLQLIMTAAVLAVGILLCRIAAKLEREERQRLEAENDEYEYGHDIPPYQEWEDWV